MAELDIKIDDSKQDEDGMLLYIGSTTIVSVWDAGDPEREKELAYKIRQLLLDDAQRTRVKDAIADYEPDRP